MKETTKETISSVRPEPRAGEGERARRVAAEQAKSIPRLLRDLIDESRTLLQNEVRLARVEGREMLGVVQRNLTAIGIGAGFVFASLVALVLACSAGLTAAFRQWTSPETAMWLAPLVVTLVFALIGWALVRKGLGAIRRRGLVPRRTAESLKENKEWLQRRVS